MRTFQGEEPDEDDAYALMASLKRIYAFYQCHDLNSWNLWDTLFYITRQGMDANGIPEEVNADNIDNFPHIYTPADMISVCSRNKLI